jgi:hypothetical protein
MMGRPQVRRCNVEAPLPADSVTSSRSSAQDVPRLRCELWRHLEVGALQDDATARTVRFAAGVASARANLKRLNRQIEVGAAACCWHACPPGQCADWHAAAMRQDDDVAADACVMRCADAASATCLSIPASDVYTRVSGARGGHQHGSPIHVQQAQSATPRRSGERRCCAAAGCPGMGIWNGRCMRIPCCLFHLGQRAAACSRPIVLTAAVSADDAARADASSFWVKGHVCERSSLARTRFR